MPAAAAAAAADGAPRVCLLHFLECKTCQLHSSFVFTLRNMSSFRTDTSPAPGDQRLSINVEHLLEKKVGYVYGYKPNAILDDSTVFGRVHCLTPS